MPESRKIQDKKYREKNKAKLAIQHRAWVLAKYGLTFDQYLKALENGCEICGKKLDILHIDHDHYNKIFRGFLCMPCNTGIGFLQDDPIVLKKAAKYVEDREKITLRVTIEIVPNGVEEDKYTIDVINISNIGLSDVYDGCSKYVVEHNDYKNYDDDTLRVHHARKDGPLKLAGLALLGLDDHYE